MQLLNSGIFALAPVPMWLQDFSDVIQTLALWRQQGVVDLVSHLEQEPQRILDCFYQIKIIEVNRKALDLLEADSLEQLQTNIQRIFTLDIAHAHIEQLLHLWNSKSEYIGETLLYTLSGKRLDIQVRGMVLPDYQHDFSRVFISTEDITHHKELIRREAHQRRLAELLFHSSPAALFIYDLTTVKQGLQDLVQQGLVLDPLSPIQPEAVQRCVKKIDLLQTNQAALYLLDAIDFEHLKYELPKSLMTQPEPYAVFMQHILSVCCGLLPTPHEMSVYTLKGKQRYTYNQSTLFAYDDQHNLLQISVTDITARKLAELHLERMHQCDQLTGLYNRSFYVQQLTYYSQKNMDVISGIYVDVNHLKPVNDLYGHHTGDWLLQRVGKLLQQFTQHTDYCAARIGGDEFVILLPHMHYEQLLQALLELRHLLKLDNQRFPEQPLSLSFGAASKTQYENIEEMLKRADQNMFLDKQAYYQIHPQYLPRQFH